MAVRKNVDLSNEEPTHRADPEMDQVDLELTSRGLRLRSTLRRGSPITAAVQCLLLMVAVFAPPAAAGALMMWMGFGPVGIAVAAGVVLLVAVGLMIFVYKKTGADTDRPKPTNRPPAQRRNKGSGRRNGNRSR
ncbi:hypothetical protein ABT358_31135 [Streptomyces sp. NPDC000341]|uniref:hypothetical protein n=1 Tax=Streptomyces sp. NPDC000341 TaxID=3156645 RepID=UPI003321286C